MILLGRVYDGLMVDLQAVNQKLVRRSESILMRLTGRSGEQVREALAASQRQRKACRPAAAWLRLEGGYDDPRSRGRAVACSPGRNRQARTLSRRSEGSGACRGAGDLRGISSVTTMDGRGLCVLSRSPLSKPTIDQRGGRDAETRGSRRGGANSNLLEGLRSTKKSSERRDPGRVAINEALQKLARPVVADVAVVIDQILGEVDIYLRLSERGHIEIAEHAAQM